MIEQATNTRCDLDLRPLGIRPDVPLTDAQLTALQRLEDYDLGPVRARLLKQDMLPADRVDDAILEFRRSLGLLILGYPGVPVVSTAVDEVWHACLLLSPLYADLCEQTVGHFVHHEPVDDYEPSAKIAGAHLATSMIPSAPSSKRTRACTGPRSRGSSPASRNLRQGRPRRACCGRSSSTT